MGNRPGGPRRAYPQPGAERADRRVQPAEPGSVAVPFGEPALGKEPDARVAVDLSDRVNALTSRNVLVVDLMCDARLYLPSNYASDGFHPNDGGYAIFAELTLPALTDEPTAPSTTCPQRTVFP